jgi:signal transduction histidine kinase
MAVFDAAAAEVEGLLDAHGVLLGRYERGENLIVVAHRGSYAAKLPPGTRVSHQGHNVTTMVRRSARPARLKHDERAAGPLAALVRDMGVRESVGAPIVVDGRLWGIAIANWRDQSPPAGTEERMAQFAQLLETAIANADSRDQLNASRARLLTAGDEARRSIVRDLHDGAQQRLVHTVITLGLAQRAMRQRDQEAESLVAEAVEYAQQANEQLRELARGLLPADLTSAGLRGAVDSIVERLDLPVTLDVAPERLPAEIEANAYFILAEALTNIVKHAGASQAAIRVVVDDGALRVEVRDDGIGGADPEGHGLVGLRDRATALGGRLHVESSAGGGTLLAATLPLSSNATIEAEEKAAR